MTRRVTALVVLYCFIAMPAFACLFDTDCFAVGSKCVREESSIEGTCKGGLGSGNSDYSQERPEFFPNLDASSSDTCSFDTDCEVDQRCIKKIGTRYGVCMKSDERQDERLDDRQD
jgi:hypothetical protein